MLKSRKDCCAGTRAEIAVTDSIFTFADELFAFVAALIEGFRNLLSRGHEYAVELARLSLDRHEPPSENTSPSSSSNFPAGCSDDLRFIWPTPGCIRWLSNIYVTYSTNLSDSFNLTNCCITVVYVSASRSILVLEARPKCQRRYDSCVMHCFGTLHDAI